MLKSVNTNLPLDGDGSRIIAALVDKTEEMVRDFQALKDNVSCFALYFLPLLCRFVVLVSIGFRWLTFASTMLFALRFQVQVSFIFPFALPYNICALASEKTS